MEKLTQNLLLHELILMVLGVLLFFTVLISLAVYLARKQPINKLIAFFLLSIIMIGFPAVQSVSFDGLLDVTMKKAEEVNADPGNETKAKELTELLKDVENKRAENDPKALTVISNAYAALGQYDTAETIVNKALDIDKGNENAKSAKEDIAIKQKIKKDFERKVSVLNNQVAALEADDHANEADIKKVVKTLSEIKPPIYVDDQSLLTVARALNAVGDKQNAMVAVNKVVESKPESVEAGALKSLIVTDTAKLPAMSPAVMETLKGSQVITNKNKLLMNAKATHQ